MSTFSPISKAIEELRSGKFLIVVDDESRENEGDLVMAAEHITAEKMAMMIRSTGGVVCLALSNAIADQLDLPPMVSENTSRLRTPFTVSIEAKEGVTTGISAHDRARTVRTAINPVARPEDLVRPGHVFPLRAAEGGTLIRAGHTEAAVDLCHLTGLREGAVLSELMNDDGTTMSLPDLERFAHERGIAIVSIANLIAFRRVHETFVRRESSAHLETETGLWKMHVYTDSIFGGEYVALVKGDVASLTPVLVRVHSECLTGDVFHSKHCDCGDQLRLAMEMMEREGSGVVLYMRQEGRGIGLKNKVRAYDLQQREGLDTVEANERLGFPMDLREYGIGAQILKDIGVSHFRLLTNNPRKVVGLSGHGLHLVAQVPLEVRHLTERQKNYLRAKREKMGHTLRNV